jgi:hypothetical protein
MSDAIQKRTRKKIVRQFKAHNDGVFNDNQERIFETYIDDGLHYLKEALDITSNTEKLDSYLKKEDNQTSEEMENLEISEFEILSPAGSRYNEARMQVHRNRRLRYVFKNLGLLVVDENKKSSVNKKTKESLRIFIDFVLIKQS